MAFWICNMSHNKNELPAAFRFLQNYVNYLKYRKHFIVLQNL